MKALQYLWTLSLCVSAVVCEADEAQKWLDRMGTALREQNYEGTFTYMRGSQFETVKIMHQFNDGQERERLLNLNGEPREVIRQDSEVVCHHMKSGTPLLSHDVPLGPFSSAFNENLALNHDQYRFSLHGMDRIADRTTVRLKITPRFDDRFGYQLWLDEETGLLLQSQLLQRNRVLELFQFANIEIGQPLEVALTSSLGNDTLSHRLTPDIQTTANNNKPRWRVSWLPKGFRPVKVSNSNRLHFTDGLAGLSIFFERKASAIPEMTTHLGATTVITRRLKDAEGQITVVGEVPINTARKIAESVEPVVY